MFSFIYSEKIHGLVFIVRALLFVLVAIWVDLQISWLVQFCFILLILLLVVYFVVMISKICFSEMFFYYCCINITACWFAFFDVNSIVSAVLVSFAGWLAIIQTICIDRCNLVSVYVAPWSCVCWFIIWWVMYEYEYTFWFSFMVVPYATYFFDVWIRFGNVVCYWQHQL